MFKTAENSTINCRVQKAQSKFRQKGSCTHQKHDHVVEEWRSTLSSTSPDLSPIEDVWSIMAPIVYASPELRTLTALEGRLRKLWRSISLTTVQNLIGLMPDNLRQSSETKETVFRPNICALSWGNVVCCRVCAIFGVATLVSIIIVAGQLPA